MTSFLNTAGHILSCAIVAASAAVFAQSATGRASTSPPKPVLVELFTSEGCSDCPPADALLARLDSTQFVPGAYAIVLSEHVTYWNHLGWSDPFSFPDIDQRQQRYGDRFGLSSVYTPQIVVDGAQQFVGSDASRLSQALRDAAPKQPLTIDDAHWARDGIHFSLHAAAIPGAHLLAALATESARTQVSAGENARRTLQHVAVVRALKDFNPNFADGRTLTLSTSNVEQDTAAVPLRLIVFLADGRTGRVLAVTQQKLNMPAH